MEDIKLKIGKTIKNLRVSLAISQEDLAKKTGYTDRSSIAKIEKGLVDLTQSKVELFAKALQTTPSYLMGWDDKKTTAATDSNFIKKYKKLDDIDKGKTEAYVDGLLDNEKYKKGIESLNA